MADSRYYKRGLPVHTVRLNPMTMAIGPDHVYRPVNMRLLFPNIALTQNCVVIKPRTSSFLLKRSRLGNGAHGDVNGMATR